MSSRRRSCWVHIELLCVRLAGEAYSLLWPTKAKFPIYWEGSASPPGEIQTSRQFLVSGQANVYGFGRWEEAGVATEKPQRSS